MKNKKVVWLFLVLVLAVVSVVSFKTVTAVTYNNYRTTLIDSEGLDIEIATIRGDDVINEEEYIKANINTEYAEVDQMIPTDIIMVKHLIAEDAKLPAEKTINAMWANASDAFIMLNDTYVLLYDTDANSDYYVGYVNTMNGDYGTKVTDVSFAYTNLNGEVISDAIYDYENGIAYVPKKYTAENKNGEGLCNIQIELLQAVNSEEPSTLVNVIVEKNDNIKGDVYSSGNITVSSIATKFGVKVTLNEQARQNITPDHFKVSVNGAEIREWTYYDREGILVVEAMPSTIETLTINIDEANIQANVDARADVGIDAQANMNEIPAYGDAGKWVVDGIPEEGAQIIIKGSEYVNVWYDAWDHDSEHGNYLPSLPLYYEAGHYNVWTTLVDKILNGGTINPGNLGHNTTWIQYHVSIHNDMVATDGKVNYEIPAGDWLLKCVHDAVTFKTEWWRENNIDQSAEIRLRIFSVTDDYILVGMLTSMTHNQTGSGLFKIAYEGGTGNIAVGKKDEHGNFVAGATLAVSGPDGYYQEIVTKNEPTVLEQVKKGEYTVTELEAPVNMVKNNTPVKVNVEMGQTPEAFVVNNYQRGSARLTKYDAEHRGATLGDATLQGAEYELRAETDIYEGIKKIYSANDVIKTVITDENGETQAVENLPIGKYYYIETKPSEGFNINNAKISVEVEYAGQDAQIAAEAHNEAPEIPITSNLRIIKTLGATDYDPIIPLEDVQFELTLKSDSTQKYLTTMSNEQGVCEAYNIPYGLYTCSEVKLNDMGYKVPDFDINFTENGKTYEYEKEDPPKMMQIEVIKELLKETRGKTDAKVSGAYFTIYTDEAATIPYRDKYGNIVVIGPTDVNGYATSKKMRTNTYYLKETTFPEGIDPDAIIPGENVTYRDKIYVAKASNKTQGNQIVRITFESIINKPIMGSVEVIKFDNDLSGTTESPAKGAILRLSLDSNPNCYYDATINENGYAEFVNEDLRDEYYPYTIPYGEYTITEVKPSDGNEHTDFYIQPIKINIRTQTQQKYTIFGDEPVEMYLQIEKIDQVTGKVTKIEGAKFKVWDCAKNKFVSQITYPDGSYIDEFTTNENGELTLPHKLEAGEYIVYETESPNGYYLEDKWRLPKDEKDLGKKDGNGKYVLIDKQAMGIVENTTANKVELYYKTELEDRPLVGKLEVYKTGEMLTDSSQEGTEFGTKYTPKYTNKGLPGVTYEIYAAKDIVSPDGQEIYITAGTFVGDMTTDERGYALSEELYLGEYKIVETVTPKGYVTDTDIPNVVLTNEDKTERVKITKKDLNNVRQKLKLTIEKKYDEIKHSDGKNTERFSTFGVYTNEDIKNVNGTIVIGKNSLMDIITIKGDTTDVTSNVDLPEGKYYVEELATSYPYTLSEESLDIELKHSGTIQEYVTIPCGEFHNTIPYTNLTLIKVSTVLEGDVILSDGNIENSKLDATLETILETIKGMSIDEVKDYLGNPTEENKESQNLNLVEGAEYTLFMDENCTEPLYVKDEKTGEFVVAKLVTDKLGMAISDPLPIGQYYLKETYAPLGYKEVKEDEIVSISLTREVENQMVYRILKNVGPIGLAITKTDIFTGEAIPNCKFEITDKDGNILLYSVTDENGEGAIAIELLENGETYYYREIEAPGIYDLNTEPHEFVADYTITEDGDVDWHNPIKVENRRKTINELIVRKVDDETGEPLQGCKFSIILIDEEGNPVLNPDGENVYLVKEAVTGENGEYVVEKPYYGIYQFIEVEAPEGYEMKVDMEGMVFEINADSPETIIFEVTNTGDIAVYTLAALAVVSVLGIAFVIVRNRKQRA